MSPTRTLPQREKELQALLATPAGRKELQQLEAQYQENVPVARLCRFAWSCRALPHHSLGISGPHLGPPPLRWYKNGSPVAVAARLWRVPSVRQCHREEHEMSVYFESARAAKAWR